MANTFSETLVESRATQCRALAARADVQDTIRKTRRLIQESRELMADADKMLNGGWASQGKQSSDIPV